MKFGHLLLLAMMVLIVLKVTATVLWPWWVVLIPLWVWLVRAVIKLLIMCGMFAALAAVAASK